jgi:hypothetical protein
MPTAASIDARGVRADARYSRKSVRLLVFRSSARVCAELHEQAFRRLGGATRIVVLDNLREGVLAHYGVTALPCRVRDPDRKGKVESGAGHAQKTPLKGQRFESLAEAQAYPIVSIWIVAEARTQTDQVFCRFRGYQNVFLCTQVRQ